MKKVFNFLHSIWDKGFFHVLIANFLIALVAFGSQLFVAKVLTDIQLGYIKIFQSFTQILSLFAGMGFSTSVLIVCSCTQNVKQKLEHLSVALYAVVPISIIVLALFIVINQFDLWTPISEVKLLFDKYSYIVVFTAIIAVYTAFIQSSKIFKKYSNLVILTKFVSIGFIVLFTYWRGFYGFFDGTCVGLVLSLIINISFVKNEFDFYLNKKINRLSFKIKEQFKLGIHGLGTNIFGMLASNLDIIFMNLFLTNQLNIIGQYSFAAIIVMGLSMIQSTIVQVTVPYLAKYNDNYSTISCLLKKYNRILFWSTVLLLLLLYVFIPIGIEWIYGDKYAKGLFYLIFLLGVWAFKCLNAINSAYFLASGKSHLSNLVNFVNMIFTAATVFVALLFFTVEVMIIGMILVNLCVTLYSYLLVKRSLKRLLVENDRLLNN